MLSERGWCRRRALFLSLSLGYILLLCLDSKWIIRLRYFLQRLTNENKAGSDDVREQVASERFVVLTITFTKDANQRVEFVLAQTLQQTNKEKSKNRVEKKIQSYNELTSM